MHYCTSETTDLVYTICVIVYLKLSETLDALDTVGEVSRYVATPVAERLHEAMDMYTTHMSGIVMALKVDGKWYVNADSTYRELPVTKERVKWNKDGRKVNCLLFLF